MAIHGGRYPYDELNALVGPCRVVWAETTAAVPADMTDIVAAVANAQGEYVAATGWNDFGLTADAPGYSHDKDTEGIEFQQPTSALFEQVSEVNRGATVPFAEFTQDILKIMENTAATSAIAASAAAAPDKFRSQKKIKFGTYETLREKRVAFIGYRPDGAGEVTEPAPSPVPLRPPAVILVLPRVRLAAEETSLEWERGSPVSGDIAFSVRPEPTLPSGEEHGFWLLEDAGAIAA